MMDEEQFLGYSDCFVFISCFSDMIRRGGGGKGFVIMALAWSECRSSFLPFWTLSTPAPKFLLALLYITNYCYLLFATTQ